MSVFLKKRNSMATQFFEFFAICRLAPQGKLGLRSCACSRARERALGRQKERAKKVSLQMEHSPQEQPSLERKERPCFFSPSFCKTSEEEKNAPSGVSPVFLSGHVFFVDVFLVAEEVFSRFSSRQTRKEIIKKRGGGERDEKKKEKKLQKDAAAAVLLRRLLRPLAPAPPPPPPPLPNAAASPSSPPSPSSSPSPWTPPRSSPNSATSSSYKP